MDKTKLKESILSILKHGSELKVKKLRKQVLLSLQQDETDKTAKKAFKKTIQELETNKTLTLDVEGIVKLQKRKLQVSDSPHQKKKAKTDDATNPQGITRLFLGNLPFAVNEDSLEAFIPGMTHVKWITDKETGKFYGSAFVEMDTPESASRAVAHNQSQLMGRPIKINYAAARPGDKWPPDSKSSSGGATTGKSAGGTGIQNMSKKPLDCRKLFVGNLSYDIDDEGITKFFRNADAEVKAVRWLHHQDTGDFKGVGFVEFWNAEACEKAATLNGKNLLGRPIRIDWTD